MSRLRHFCRRIAEQLQHALCPLRLVVDQNPDRLLQCCFTKIAADSSGLSPFDTIQKCSDVEQFGAMFKELHADDLLPVLGAGFGEV